MSSLRDPTIPFSGRVDDYVKGRPHYPDALVDLVEHEAQLAPASRIADVGSGTGRSEKPFLRRPCRNRPPVPVCPIARLPVPTR